MNCCCLQRWFLDSDLLRDQSRFICQASKTEIQKWSAATIAIIVVASYCLLYPFLTYALHERYIVLLNLIALLMAAALSIIVVNEYVAAFWYTLPLLVWCAYVVFSDIMQYNSVIEKFGLNKYKSKSK